MLSCPNRTRPPEAPRHKNHVLRPQPRSFSVPHSILPGSNTRSLLKRAKMGPRAPALLIPGICGSVLHVRETGDDSEGTRRWVVAERADTAYHLLWGRYNTETRHIDSLRNDEVIVPTGGYEDGGLYGLDILDPSFSFYPPAALRYYHTLIGQMKSWGYVAGETLYGFAYDFRQSNLIHLPGLLAKLEEISKSNGGVKVDVVTHSMGGLLFKMFLAKYPDDFRRLVRSWVSVAAPFNGAPGFSADAFLTGVQFVHGWANYFFIQKETMRQMVCQAPAVFELLPGDGFDWGDTVTEPRVSIWIEKDCDADHDAEGDGASAIEDKPPAVHEQWSISGTGLRDLLLKCMQDNQVDVDGESVDLPFPDKIMDHADEARLLLATAKLPEGFAFVNIFGTGLDTPFSISYGTAEEPLAQHKDLHSGNSEANFSLVDGDGTVPSVSAQKDGIAAVQRIGLAGDHRQLLEDPATFELIQGLFNELPSMQTAETHALPGKGPQLHFYAGYKFWEFCTESDDMVEQEGWLIV